MKFNPGKFVGNKYIKQVSFSKAVLWKDRQISLNDSITRQFKPRGIEFVVFEDERKNERWTATVETLRTWKERKQEGQEAQFYFPISVFKKEKIRDEKELKQTSEVPL